MRANHGREHLDAAWVDMMRMAFAAGGERWEVAQRLGREFVEEVVRPAKGSFVADEFLRVLAEITAQSSRTTTSRT